jgi:Fe-S cluster assembly ATPase SufC
MDTTLFESVIGRADFLRGIYEDKKSHAAQLSQDVKNLQDEKDILEKTEKVLKHLTDKLVHRDLTKMNALITYGLKTVFSDRSLSFEASIEERGSKIWIDLRTLNRDQVLDAHCRGSVHVIESFLLRLLCIIKMKRAKIIFLDETFAAVDSDYIEPLSLLIKELCEKLGLSVLLVTHNRGFLEFADHSYRASLKNKEAEINKIK